MGGEVEFRPRMVGGVIRGFPNRRSEVRILSGAPFFISGARVCGKGGMASRRLLLLCCFLGEFEVIVLGSELGSSRSNTDAGVGPWTALRRVDHTCEDRARNKARYERAKSLGQKGGLGRNQKCLLVKPIIGPSWSDDLHLTVARI